MEPMRAYSPEIPGDFPIGMYCSVARWPAFPPRFAEPNTPSNDLFSFCRILYESVRREPSGYGWNTDYPYSDINFHDAILATDDGEDPS